MKKSIILLFLISTSINFYFLYLKEKIEHNVKIQIFLSLFDSGESLKMVSDTIKKDSIMSSIKILSPVSKINITSSFGNRIHPISKNIEFHNGVDLSGIMGDNIYSSDIGYVKNVLYNDKGGNQIIIRYKDYECGYAHLSSVLVKVGDVIASKQIIGKMGNSGSCTGIHLHFTLKTIDGKYLNPKIYLDN